MIRRLFYFWNLNGEDRNQKNVESLNPSIKYKLCYGKDVSMQVAKGKTKITDHWCASPARSLL